uniref:Transporter n=1 Tax=Denticeps clupeoides TaxID=299321 RepID=A0AAY4EM00_9TELE
IPKNLAKVRNRHAVMEKAPLPADAGAGEGQHTDMAAGEQEQEFAVVTTRDGWDSKLEYVLAQVGFSVGLGNVWRFPYLCHQNGGGAFMLLYILLMLLVGVPLFFLELAAGQSIRQGSIGVWKQISPKLAGIGFSSCVVCFFVALYYNVIISWSLFYLGNSFQNPLPWEKCPQTLNGTMVKECELSSPTTYFWFREALDITNSINQIGEFNPIITGCLLAAWAIVFLAMFKGIKSSGKVMYFSSVFPYIVLLCFLIRGLLLDGASEGIIYMLYPKLEIWGSVKVWRQAATQVFFALGLGFGSVIAYSSYNPRKNNCHRDALMVSSINFLTSVLASLVVFAVLGFRAKNIALHCVRENLQLVSGLSLVTSDNPHLFNNSDVTLEEYTEWYHSQGAQLPFNLSNCSLETEMNKGVDGTGLAFIAFTEAMTQFPAAPFWSAMFFLMLLNLGLSTMFGTMEGMLTPLADHFTAIANCVVGFGIGLLFTQRCGNYFVTMFDDYSATLPLIIVVVFENFSVAWIYGADRFLKDIEKMLQWHPPLIYKYLWKYVCPLAMIGLLGASLLNMFFETPSYSAWDRDTASKVTLAYPGWALALLTSLIIIATLPVPICYIHHTLLGNLRRSHGQRGGANHSLENGNYTWCSTEDPDVAAQDSTSLSPVAEENYRLLNQEDEEESSSV